MDKKVLNNLFLISGLIVLTGCGGGGAVDLKDDPGLITDDAEVVRETVEKLEPGEVLMMPVGDLNYYAGMPAGITVVVRNIGSTQVNFPKWHLRDEDNLRFYYTPCDAEGNIDEENAVWTSQTPVIENPSYYPVVLMPENSALLQGDLSFIEDLPADTPESYYLVVVELNNDEVEVSSPPFVVKICELK